MVKSAITLEDLAREVLNVIPVVMRALRTRMRASRAVGLSVPQFRVLSFVHRRGTASLSDIAEHMGLTLPSMSKMVDGLLSRGLVDRAQDEADRRRIAIWITPRGIDASAATRADTQQWLAERLRRLDPRERQALLQGLTALEGLFSGEGVKHGAP